MFARRRPQLFCQQPSPRSLPSLSGWRGSRARGRKVSALKVVLPSRSRRESFSAESLGPMLLAAARLTALAQSRRGRLRWAGGGSHRLAVPGREQLGFRCRALESTVTPARGMRPHGALGWTPSRPPATTIKSRRGAPSGRASWITCRATERVRPSYRGLRSNGSCSSSRLGAKHIDFLKRKSNT
jgi:hypothetical protein